MAVGPVDYTAANNVANRNTSGRIILDPTNNLGVINSGDTLRARRLAFTAAKLVCRANASIDLEECAVSLTMANTGTVSGNGFSFDQGTIDLAGSIMLLGDPTGAAAVFGAANGQRIGTGITGDWSNTVWESNGPINFNFGAENFTNQINETNANYGFGIVHQRIPGKQFPGVNWAEEFTSNAGSDYNYRTIRVTEANFLSAITAFWQCNHSGWGFDGNDPLNHAINVNPQGGYNQEWWFINPESLPTSLTYGNRTGSGTGGHTMTLRVLQGWNPRIVNATTTQLGTDIQIGKVDTNLIIYRKDDVFDTTNLNKTTVGDNFDYLSTGFTGFLIQNQVSTGTNTSISSNSVTGNVNTAITNRDFRIWSYLLDNFDNAGDIIVHESQPNNCAAINGVFSTFDEIALPESLLATISDSSMIPTVPSTLDDVAAIVHNNTRVSNTTSRSVRANGSILEIIGSGESIISNASGISRENTSSKVITIGVGTSGRLSAGTRFTALSSAGNIRYSRGFSGITLTTPILLGGSTETIEDSTIVSNINVDNLNIVRTNVTPTNTNLITNDHTQVGGTFTLANDLTAGGNTNLSGQARIRTGNSDYVVNDGNLNNCIIESPTPSSTSNVTLHLSDDSNGLTLEGSRAQTNVFGPHILESFTSSGNMTLGVNQLVACNINVGEITNRVVVLNGLAGMTFVDSPIRTPYILRGTYNNVDLEIPSGVTDVVIDRDTNFTGTCNLIRATAHTGTVTVRQIMQPTAIDTGGQRIEPFTRMDSMGNVISNLTLGQGVELEAIPQTTRQETILRINVANQPDDAQYVLWNSTTRSTEVTFSPNSDGIVEINQGIIRDADTPTTYVLGVTHRFRTPTFFVRTVIRNTATTGVPQALPDPWNIAAINDESTDIATGATVRTAGTGMNVHNGVIVEPRLSDSTRDTGLTTGLIKFDISGFPHTNFPTEEIVQRTFAEVRHSELYLRVLSLWHTRIGTSFADGDVIIRNPIRLLNQRDVDLLNGHYALIDTETSNQLLPGVEDTLPEEAMGADADFTRRADRQGRINLTTRNAGTDSQEVKGIPREPVAATQEQVDEAAEDVISFIEDNVENPIVGQPIQRSN